MAIGLGWGLRGGGAYNAPIQKAASRQGRTGKGREGRNKRGGGRERRDHIPLPPILDLRLVVCIIYGTPRPPGSVFKPIHQSSQYALTARQRLQV